MVLHLLRCRFSFVKFLNIVKMAYRINGFEQIKGFYSWVFNNPDKVRPTHISLYLFLLNQNNRSNWVEWFKCPYDLAMQGACIGNKGTYYKCLDDLKSWGIIDYKKGINNYKAPIVKLFQMYDNEQLTEQVTVPLSEPQTVPLTVPQTGPLTVPIYKLITDNEKLLTENIESVKVFILELKKKNTGKDNKEKNNIFNFKNQLLNLGVDEKIATDWMLVRKNKKATNTETAFNSLKSQIEKSGLTANECIKIAVERSWSGFYSQWLNNIQQKGSHSANTILSNIDLQEEINRF